MFKNIFFYIYFALSFLLFYVMFLGDTVSMWSWFGSWTKDQNVKLWEWFIRQSDFDDISVNTVFANLRLWNQNYSNFELITKSVELIDRWDVLIMTDIVSLLEDSADKPVILETYVNKLSSIQDEIDAISSSMYDLIQERKINSQDCETSKLSSDIMFNEWVSTNDKDKIFEWLSDSLKNWPCYMENRISSRAYAVLYNKLIFYNKLIKAKYDIIVNNQDQILQNFLLFKNTYLEDLTWIRDQLRTYTIDLSK